MARSVGTFILRVRAVFSAYRKLASARRSAEAEHGDRRAFRSDAGACAGGSGNLSRGPCTGSLDYSARRTEADDGGTWDSVRRRRGIQPARPDETWRAGAGDPHFATADCEYGG